ncbi:MAG: YcxB family protein [Chloroflexi bacterium]|nr:YcxB family protein [Chloroflexota bacterium]
MEVIFQNKIEDYQAFGEYYVTETKQGKRLSMQLFRLTQFIIIMFTALLGAFTWAITTKVQAGVNIFVICFLAMEAISMLRSKFKPIYHEGIQLFNRQISSMSPKDLSSLQLQKQLKIDDDWVEIRSPDTEHRWRWKALNQIGVTSDFIFIFSQTVVSIIIPKRAFSTEQSFIEFGRMMVELKEKNRD